MSAGNTLKVMPMIKVNSFTDLNAVTWTDVTSGGLQEALGRLYIITGSSLVFVSYDGVTTHDIVANGYPREIIPQLSATPTNNVATFPKGMKIYLKLDSAPGVGNVYIVGYYQTK